MRSRYLTAVALMLPAVLACGVLAGGCSRAADAPFVPKDVAAPAHLDPARPCLQPAPGTAQPTAGTAGTARPAPVAVRAALRAGVITLSAGEDVTLSALSAAVRSPAVLRELGPGEWWLGADLVILPGASLRIAAPETRWLKLRSEAGKFVSVKALGGGLAIEGSCVSSWDTAAGRADTENTDGRAFLLARGKGEMTVDHAQIRYLGYGAVESYGLSWRELGTRGSLVGSSVSNLYYGVYSYQVDGLVIRGNEVYDNVLYGIDPHTGSRRLVIEANVVHDNGKHGIILAEECVDSVIRGNVVYRNGHHGIVLYQRSDRNTVEDNETFLNAAQGINVNESSDNVVRGNRAYRNGESGIGVGETGQRNAVEDNQVRANQQDGVRLVSEAAHTAVRRNVIGDNVRYGIYVDGDGGFEVAANTIFGSRVGVLLKGTDDHPDGDNTIRDNPGGDVKIQ